MKSALLIAYWFPPASNHTWRSYHIYRQLKEHFTAVRVLTAKHRNAPSDTNAPEASRDVLRIAAFDYRTLLYLNRKNSGHTTETRKNKLAFWFYHLLNSFPFNLIVGEGGLIYILTGFLKSKAIVKLENPELVISSFRPYSDHFIAFLLKRRYPNLTWIADFRDLHLDPALNETFFPRFQNWCNRKILQRADVVTTVSKGLAEHLKPFHPNVVVLRNGIGISAKAPDANCQLPTANCFTITYTGSMFRDLRRPDLLLEAISELFEEKKMVREKVSIVYAGKDEAVWWPLLKKYELASNFTSLGSISHGAAVRLQRSAHVNLLLTYATPELKGNATGKLYEYLAARQPVLLLVNGCRDEELEEIFDETGAGLVAYGKADDLASVKNFLLKYYEEWLATGTVQPVIDEEGLAPFRWEHMMKKLLEETFSEKCHAEEAV